MKHIIAYSFCAGRNCRRFGSFRPDNDRTQTDRRYSHLHILWDLRIPFLNVRSESSTTSGRQGDFTGVPGNWNPFHILKWLSVCVLVMATSCFAGTYTAASCNYSDVNAVINGPTHSAVDGDIIKIPAGSCTWTTGIKVPSGIGITIIGSGTPNSDASTTGANSTCTATTITDNVSTGALISMTPSYGNSTSRISCMKMVPTVPNPGFGSPIQVVGSCTTSGCPNLRIDNLTAPSSWAANGISDDSFALPVNVFGVADHDTIGDVQPASNGVDFVNPSMAAWQGVGQNGDNSWASPDTIGTAQAFYVENSVFNYALITDTDTILGSGGGGRFVCRFNVVNSISTGGGCSDHGTDTTGRTRGGRQYEVYRNTGICTNATQGCPSFSPGRSGTGIIFGNTFTNSGGGFFKSIATLDAQRRWRPDSPWGSCDGTSAWDQNGPSNPVYSGTIGSVSSSNSQYVITDSSSPGWSTNKWAQSGTPYSFVDVTKGFGYEVSANSSNTLTTGYTGSYFGVNVPSAGDSYQIRLATACIDQPARGAGGLVQGTTPTLSASGSAGSVNEALDPIYEFEDKLPGSYAPISSNEGSIVANRDFYQESSNQGAQTSPTSPFDGTSGTGHGTLANRPATCTPNVGYWATDQGTWNHSGKGEQGQLFVCSSTNTWTLYYQPYSYPHPLESGTGITPAPPTNVTATPSN